MSAYWNFQYLTTISFDCSVFDGNNPEFFFNINFHLFLRVFMALGRLDTKEIPFYIHLYMV